jgi:hypothetical protein
VQVAALANDDVGVTKVTFAIDGNWAARDVSAPYTFDWNSSMYPDGVREIQATAFDVDGNTSTYSIHVTVDSLHDIQQPSVSITAPAEGVTVSGAVQVMVSATDNQQISKVDFGVDGVWVGKATAAPYTFSWNTLTFANGLHKLQATAYDLAGNSSQHIIDVTINNATTDSEAPNGTIAAPAGGAIQDPGGGSGGGGGCTLGSNRSFDPIFILMLIVSSAIVCLRRMHVHGVSEH